MELLQSSLQALGRLWQRLICALFNLRRRLLRKRLDGFVVFTLDRELEERDPEQPWWYQYLPGYKPPQTLEALNSALRRVAADPAVKGILFLVKTPALSLAQAQSLARLVDRFREWDRAQNHAQPPKTITFHLEQISTPTYIAACAADRIFITPLTGWEVLGLRATPTFLKNTLAKLGVEMDVVQIAPWKSALDSLARTEMSPEFAEQFNWLFDSWYDDIVQAIAKGRGNTVDEVKAIIDQAPLDATQALAHGLVEGIAYEDELPSLLGTGAAPAQLRPYQKLRGLLLRRPQAAPAKAVGVITMQGSIMPGESRSQPIELPILGKQTLGSSTAQQQIRAVRQDESLAAVVIYVDSPGGSALASDLIWRELQLLQQEKPVVVYMGNVAASGGYYIAMGAQHVVAQPATLTGSIGVITGKAVTSGTYAKLAANREVIQRGAHAGLYADDQHWLGSERAKIEEGILYVYELFKTRVAEGRKVPYATLDAIANGRVWTGTQALAHGLVDELGDFQLAVDQACMLAALPTDGSVQLHAISAPKQKLLAEPISALQEAMGLTAVHRLGHLADLILADRWQTLFTRERYWLLVHELPRIK
ncbi:MAG: signal peptide peptidase SppA [Caldilineaceae bacterium]